MEITKYKKLPYPRNLWSAVFQRSVQEKELPHDWNETLTFIFHSLNDPKKEAILLYYFRDGMTVYQIAKLYNNAHSTIQHQLARSILKLQDLSRIYIMEYGIKTATHMKENKIGYWAETISLSEDEDFACVLALPIDVLGMGTRPYNCLRRMGIETIGQLISHSRKELLTFRTAGTGIVDEITRCLAKHRLFLREDPDPIR